MYFPILLLFKFRILSALIKKFIFLIEDKECYLYYNGFNETSVYTWYTRFNMKQMFNFSIVWFPTIERIWIFISDVNKSWTLSRVCFLKRKWMRLCIIWLVFHPFPEDYFVGSFFLLPKEYKIFLVILTPVTNSSE